MKTQGQRQSTNIEDRTKQQGVYRKTGQKALLPVTQDPFVQNAMRDNHFREQYEQTSELRKIQASMRRSMAKRGKLGQENLDNLRKQLSKKNPFRKAAQ